MPIRATAWGYSKQGGVRGLLSPVSQKRLFISMASATVQPSFVTYTNLMLPNDGDTLPISFSLRPAASNEVDNGCSIRIPTKCPADGIANVSEAILEWRTDCNTNKRIVSSVDSNPFISVEIDEDDDDLAIGVEASIRFGIATIKNFFKLYIVANAIKILVARGTIYTEIANSAISSGGTTLVLDDFVVGEIPTGLIDGSNATFLTAFPIVSESIAVYINGLLQQRTVDYNAVGHTIEFATPPEIDDVVIVDYIIFVE